jgi:hypothetical protein
LRFAVHRPGIPEAFPRSHGVSRRDVLGRVHVGIAGISAGGTSENGLALARLPIDLPACRAALTSECGVNLLDPAGRFLFQAADQQAPSGPHDAPVKPRFLSDIPTRFLPAAPGGSDHLLDLEVFNPDYVEAPCDIGGGLLCPVPTPVRLAGAQPRDSELHSGAAVRPALRFGQLALQPPHASALRCGQAGRVQQLPCGQGHGHGHASVETYDLVRVRPLDRHRDRGERDVPASRPVHRHTVGLHTQGYGPGPAEPHPSNLRHAHFADVAGDAAYVPLPPVPPHDAKSLIQPSLPPGRPTGWVRRVHECDHGLVEIPQRLLLHRLGACCQPRVPGAGLSELSALLQVAWRAFTARMPVRVLLDGHVPYVAGVRAVLPQQRLLGGRGEQTVPRHANTLAISTVISGEVKRRLLPKRECTVSAPRSR